MCERGRESGIEVKGLEGEGDGDSELRVSEKDVL